MKHLYNELWLRRALISFMVKRTREAGVFKTVLGHAWYVINPLAMAGVYYFLFVVLFRRSFGAVHPLVLIMVGITHWLFISNVVNSGCRAILNNQSLLMQVKIEPLVFPAVSFWNNIKDFTITILVLTFLYFFLGPPLSVKLLAYPLILILLLVGAWSMSVICATFTVFYRDLPPMFSIVLRFLMYLAPVVYPVTFVPEEYLVMYLANPIATIFNLIQWSALGVPLPPSWAILNLGFCLLMLWWLAHQSYLRFSKTFTKAF